MAICGHCGAQIRDDVWVCSACGEPVATAKSPGGSGAPDPAGAAYAQPAAGPAPANGGPAPTYGGPAPAYGGPAPAYGQPAPASGGPAPAYGQPAPAYEDPLLGALSTGKAKSKSKLVWIVGIGGLVAVVAIVLVWAFVLRGGGGGDPTPYLGTWSMQLPTTMATSGISSFTVAFTRQGDGAEMSLVSQGQTFGPFKTTVEADKLVTRFEIADGASDVQKQAAEMMHNLFGAMVDDFRMVFKPSQQADTLVMSVEGKVNGQQIDSSTNQQMTLTKVSP